MSNRGLYLATVLIWGTTWIAIEFQLGIVAPEVSIFYRYLLAALVLFAWCGYRQLDLRFPASAHRQFLMLGILLFSLNYITTYHAQYYISSAMSAIAFSMMVWMNIVNARLFFGTRAGGRLLLAALLGISGIAILFVPQVANFSLTDKTLFGGGLALTGALMASLGNMVSQSAQKRGLPIIQSNAWGMLYGALLTALAALVQGKSFTFDPSAGYVLSLAYLSIFGSILAFGSYLTLLGRIGAHRAGYAMVMFPVVALLMSVLFEGLELNASIVIGVALALAGNLVILQRRPSPGRGIKGPEPVVDEFELAANRTR